MIRIRKRLRQTDVAGAASVSRQTVSRIKLGQLHGVPLGTLRQVCQAVGLRVSLQVRSEGAELDRQLGARHSAMHEAMARLFVGMRGWATLPEVTFAIFGERGAIDILAWHAETRSLLVIELKTELVDMQETVGTLDRKVRLAAQIAADHGWKPLTVSAWLVVAEGSTNRRRVASHSAMLRSALPADGRTMSGWLRAPAGRVMALSFLPDARQEGTKSGFSAVNRVATRRVSTDAERSSSDARSTSTGSTGRPRT